MARIAFDKEKIAQFCKNNGIKKLALFGSAVRSDFTDKSDVDVVIEFMPDRAPSLFGFVHLMDELSLIFGRKVDLITYSSLKNHFLKQSILADEEVQYSEAG